MNQSTLSASMQRNYALAMAREEPQTVHSLKQHQSMGRGRNSQRRVFEYRGSTDLQINANFHRQNEDLNRVHPLLEPPQGGAPGSFGLSEIKSPRHGGSQQSAGTLLKPSAYQMKRQQAMLRQNGGRAGGIVGRKVDAPHIIVPSQGPGIIDFDKEQGSITQTVVTQCQPGHSTVQLTRGRQTASLSPKQSPWKKYHQHNAHGKSSGSGNQSKSKTKNLFGQVKLSFNQGGGSGTSGGQVTSAAQSRKAAQKNFKSQPGGKHGDGTKNARTSKSMEQVKHVHRNQANAPSHNTLKPFKNQEPNMTQMKKASQNAAGRRTALHGQYERVDLPAEMNKQRRHGATNRQQRSQLNNFLDQSMIKHTDGSKRAGNISSIQIQNQGSETAQNQITLNILTATADQFINQGGQISAAETTQHATGAKCKSAASRHNQNNDQSRQLIQTKYLNFQREVHHNSKKRDSKSAQQSRVNHHRTGGSRAKTALAHNGGQSRANSKGAPNNPFQQRQTSSQGRTSGSGGNVSTGHSRAFGATKNQTIEIENKRRSKSKQGISGVLSDTPDKSQSQKRARSGGSSNKRRKQQQLGASASFSPRSRATTQFHEARSLLFENQSSGVSVNSKKLDLNQLLNIDGGRQQQKQKPSNAQGHAGSQQYLVAQTQSANVLDPTYNISAVLLQPPTDPNNSVQQYLRASNDNLPSNVMDTQVGDTSQQIIAALADGDKIQEGSKSAASKKFAHLNASLGRILNQSALSHAVGQGSKKDGQSQSPKGSRGASRGAMAKQDKGQNAVSASNTSRIDKIIAENLKKQGKKTMQRKIREQEEEQVTRKKKAELEQVNERVRNTNKEKVQRRKLQQMVLMQTNNTAKPGKFSKVNDTIADAIRDEMTRMLDELPENAIVKSHKDKKSNQENIQQQATAQSSQYKLTTVKDPSQPKQLQARTQKIDLKFSAQQRIEGLLGKNQKPNGNTQHGGSKVNQSKTKQREGLPPKQLVVNRLGQAKKEPSIQESATGFIQEESFINSDHPGNDMSVIDDDLLYPGGQSQVRMAGRLKDHRKSYGLEFIDIRKEINAEMKRVGGHKSPRGTGKAKKVRDNIRGANLRCTGIVEKTEPSETSIILGGKNLRGSKSQRQVFSGQVGRSTPALDDTERNADLDVSRLLKDESIDISKVKILKPNQVNMTALRIRTGQEKKPEIQNGLGIVLKKEKIRKFMLKKQKQKQEQDERSKMEEIQKTLKVHENLLNLDKYAKKKWRVVQHGGGPRTGKASQVAYQGNTMRRHRNNLAMRKNMTLVHDQQDDSKVTGGHNLTITPSKQAIEMTEPSFNISAKLNQRVSSKQLKRMTKAALMRDTSNSGTQNIHIDPAITEDFFHPDGQHDSSPVRHQNQRQSHSRGGGQGTDQQANKSINQQLAPQFENSSSAKTLRALIRSQKQASSQSPPNFDHSRTEHTVPSSSVAKSKSGKSKGVAQQSHAKGSASGRPAQSGQSLGGSKAAGKKSSANTKVQKKRGRSANRRSAGGCTIQLNNKKLDLRMGGHTAKLRLQQPGISSAGATQHQHHIQLRPQVNHNTSLQRSSINTLESDTHSRHQSSYMRHRMPSSLRSAQVLDRDLAAKIIQKEVRKYLKGIGFYRARQIASPEREPISLYIEKRSRSHSRKSKQSKQSKSGSRGPRQHTPSQSHSPERGAMQETTIIAELSGLKQTDLFHDQVANASDQEDDIGYSEVKPQKRSRDTPPQRRSGSQQRKNRQKSSSSERESASNKYRRQPKIAPREKPAMPSLQSQQPHKQLNPVFKEINDGMTPVLHEILSVQTPQSRASRPADMDLDKPHQSEHSLSAHRMSESDYEFKQAHSSVESSSIEKLGMLAPNGLQLNDGTSQSSNSLFDRNAFQQYSQKKLQHIMQDSEHSKLIKFREEYLKYKEKKERRHIKKLFKQNEFSPRTFQLKQKQIDRWVQVQQQEIEKTKSTFIEEWEKTIQMIEDTQKNVDQMKSKMFQGAPTTGHHSNGGVTTAQAVSGAKPGVNSQLNNFNSQSCNSLSSHRNYQRAHSNNNNANGQLVLSGLGEHQRSILIEDPPKSYRSGRQEVSQIQILPIQNNSLPTETAGDEGHGSIGVLSSRRSNGQNEGGNQATTLLQYMEQRLQSHKEQKQTSLSELKNRTGDHREEEDLKQAMDQIEVVGSSNLELPAKNERENLASSQKMAGLSKTLEKLHQRKPSAGSAAVESEDLSHQPSAEFLERLERENNKEPIGSSAISDKFLGSGDFTALEDPLLGSALQSETDGDALNNNEPKLPEQDDLLSQSERLDRSNFKNQVMTIRDFSAIDSKRTSQQSETSNERDFIRMLASQQAKTSQKTQPVSEENDIVSPSAEHLEEPSIIGKRESNSASQDSQPASDSRGVGDSTKPGASDDQVKDQQSSYRSDSNEQDHNLLQEPAIISSSQSLEVPNQSSSSYSVFDPSNPNLVAAKTRASPEKQSSVSLKLSEIKALFSKETGGELEESKGEKGNDQAQKDKILDQLTDELIKSLVNDSLGVVQRGSASKDGSGSGQGSGQNHDVYYIDQLQSEKEERKEWIEMRQRHLIDNDLIRIDQYVNEIVDALLQFDIDLSMEDDDELTESQREIRDRELKNNYHVQFLKQLTQPIQKSSADTLQTLQTSEIGSYKHFETTQDLQKYPIIPVNLYLDIEKAREEALLARKGSQMSKQTQMVWESIHIQNKSFFDAINESLMKFRPYGLTGEPMPWSNKIRRLQTKVDIGSVDTERLFQMVKQEVFRWAQAFCGSLPSPVFCFPSNHHRDKEEFNDELFQENREKRLTQVLSAETIEQEHHWLNYEYEEAQVKIDLSDMILEHLVEEIVSFLNVQSGAFPEWPPASASPGKKDGEQEEPKVVEIVELHDEPEFARSSELGAAATAAEVNAYLSGPMDLSTGGKSASSLQRVDRGGPAEA